MSLKKRYRETIQPKLLKDLSLTNIHEELVYPEDLPHWREKTLFQVGTSDFLAIAEAMLPPPVFQKVQSVAEHRLL